MKSSTPVMVALQKKQSLLFIRCWLMQALGQRRKEHQPPPTRHRAGQGAGSHPGERSDMGATHLHDLWEQGLKMAEMGCA